MSGHMNSITHVGNDGQLPMTQSIQAVMAATGCKRALAKAVLDLVEPVFSHYTGKCCTLTYYYDWRIAVAYIKTVIPILAKLPSDWQARLEDAWMDSCTVCASDRDEDEYQIAALQKFAAMAETTVEIIEAIYYEDWDALPVVDDEVTPQCSMDHGSRGVSAIFILMLIAVFVFSFVLMAQMIVGWLSHLR